MASKKYRQNRPKSATQKSSKRDPEEFALRPRRQTDQTPLTQPAGLDIHPQTMGNLAQLQRTVGNQAVKRLLAQTRPGQESQKLISRQMPAIIQRAITDPTESTNVDQWVAGQANNQLPRLSPDSIVEAALSRAVRLRWYNIPINGNNYLVGLNIHYGGAFGALWIKNTATQETNDYHPHAAPQHGLTPATLQALTRHIYEYDPVLHYKATNPEPPDGDWDRQYSGA